MDQLLLWLERVGSKSWFWKIIVWVPIFAITAYLFYTLYKDSCRIAELETQRERAIEEAKNLALRVEQEKIEEKRKALKAQQEQAEKQINVVETKIEEEKKAHAVREAEIDAITDWDRMEKEWKARQ